MGTEFEYDGGAVKQNASSDKYCIHFSSLAPEIEVCMMLGEQVLSNGLI